MNGGRLDKPDDSGFYFQQEMLEGVPSAAINFDCIMNHPDDGTLIYELLQVSEEAQNEKGVSPWSSHPNRYWHKNKQKFISLWNYAQQAHATLYLVNYAPKGTRWEKYVGVIKVELVTDDGLLPNDEHIEHFTREKFKQWYQAKNAQCRKYEANRHALPPWQTETSRSGKVIGE